MKITKAMRDWCRILGDPTMCRWVKRRESSLDVALRGRSCLRDPTYVFAEKMLDAGLIRYERRIAEYADSEFLYEWIAVLTEKGIATAGAQGGE